MNKTKTEGVLKRYDSPQLEIVRTLQDVLTYSIGTDENGGKETYIGDIW